MINYLGGLKKRYDHIMTNRDDGQEGYEPSMVILCHMKPRRSFIIPISAFWKYIDPMDNRNALVSDLVTFKDMVDKNLSVIGLTACLPESRSRKQALEDMADIILAGKLQEATKILPTVCFNLCKCLRMFGITVLPQSAAQLLLFIQDGLEDLKNMPELPPEQELTMGEVTLFESGRKIATRDLTVKESDLITEGNA